jgi:hypothetical protein
VVSSIHYYPLSITNYQLPITNSQFPSSQAKFMTQIVWIARHGNRLDFVNPEWFNTAERPYDPPLSEDGIEQADNAL